MNFVVNNIGGIFYVMFYSIFKKHNIGYKIELTFREIVRTGIESIGVVAIASILGGLIAVFLIEQRLGSYIPQFYITEAISKSVIIELGALGASIALVGRAGTRITAEIATMKVNEEIDALETMAIDPYDYLVYPKMIASLISYPIMVIFSELLFIVGAMIFMVYIKGFGFRTFLFGIREHFRMLEFIESLVKGGVFGLISTSISCYFGITASKGAKGVGEATTNAVVYSVVLILLFDYFIIRVFSLWL
ncbi:MAG: hypothetical protein GWP03_00625 [Proteobacteria bacterium]|nr:hypothetical protein [Pseudomonadota bacterium]